MHARVLVLVLLALATPVAAQNLILNGDFESARLTPWKSLRPVTRLSFSSKAPVGLRDDTALQIQSIGLFPVEISQPLVIRRAGLYRARLAFRSLKGSGIVAMQGAPVGLSTSQGMASSAPVFVSAGTYTFRLLFLPTRAPFVAEVDDVVVEAVRAPGLFVSGDRSVNVAHVVADKDVIVSFGSLDLLPQPLAVPGWTGVLQLHPFRLGGLVWLGVSVVPKNGAALVARLPTTLRSLGRSFSMQPFNVTQRSIGSALPYRVR